ERFVERFRYKKNKAKQAQAKLTQIKRLESERADARRELARLTSKRRSRELVTRKSRSLGFDFLKPPLSGRTVVEATALGVAAGDKRLLTDATFAVERREHRRLVRPNGAGQ